MAPASAAAVAVVVVRQRASRAGGPTLTGLDHRRRSQQLDAAAAGPVSCPGRRRCPRPAPRTGRPPTSGGIAGPPSAAQSIGAPGPAARAAARAGPRAAAPDSPRGRRRGSAPARSTDRSWPPPGTAGHRQQRRCRRSRSNSARARLIRDLHRLARTSSTAVTSSSDSSSISNSTNTSRSLGFSCAEHAPSSRQRLGARQHLVGRPGRRRGSRLSADASRPAGRRAAGRQRRDSFRAMRNSQVPTWASPRKRPSPRCTRRNTSWQTSAASRSGTPRRCHQAVHPLELLVVQLPPGGEVAPAAAAQPVVVDRSPGRKPALAGFSATDIDRLDRGPGRGGENSSRARPANQS